MTAGHNQYVEGGGFFQPSVRRKHQAAAIAHRRQVFSDDMESHVRHERQYFERPGEVHLIDARKNQSANVQKIPPKYYFLIAVFINWI